MNQNRHRIDRADRELRCWLATQARTGVPELVLIGLSRSHAGRIERRGYVPRAWAAQTETEPPEDLRGS